MQYRYCHFVTNFEGKCKKKKSELKSLNSFFSTQGSESVRKFACHSIKDHVVSVYMYIHIFSYPSLYALIRKTYLSLYTSHTWWDLPSYISRTWWVSTICIFKFWYTSNNYRILNVLKYFVVCNVSNANWIH